MTAKAGLDDLVAAGATREDIEARPRSVSFAPAGPNMTVIRQFESLLDLLRPDAEVPTIAGALSRAVGLLCGGDAITIATAREIALTSLGRVKGLNRPSALVDAAFASLRSDGDPSGELLAAMLAPPEPWPDAVDGAALLEEIHAAITRYVILPSATAVLAAVWVVFTHALDSAGVAPMLAITSPTKRCGKTTLLSVLASMVPKALQASNMSASSVFRIIEKYRPTPLIDEADTFLNDNPELRGVINSGHTRRGACVVRVEGEDREPRTFSTWCPKAIAKIGSFPDTIEDRSIVVSLRRRARDERVEKVRLDKLPGLLEPIARRATRWARDNHAILSVYEPQMPGGLHDRLEDNLRILFAIAELAGGEWPERVRGAALELHTTVPSADHGGIQLLEDLRAIFADKGNPERLTTQVLKENLVGLEHRPWATWNKGREISPHQLANLLRPFNVRPKQFKVADDVLRGYALDQLQDAFNRYLPTEEIDGETDAALVPAARSATPLPANRDAGLRPNTIRYQTSQVAAEVADGNGHKCPEDKGGSGVADREPPRYAGAIDDEVAL